MGQSVTKSQQIQFLKSLADQTEAYTKSLERFHKDHRKAMPVTGRLAFECGIALCKTQANWARIALKELKK